MAKRLSSLSRPKVLEIIIVHDPEKVAEAVKQAAPGYRRALQKKIKRGDSSPPAA